MLFLNQIGLKQKRPISLWGVRQLTFWYLFFIPKYDEHQSKQASKSGIAKFAH